MIDLNKLKLGHMLEIFKKCSTEHGFELPNRKYSVSYDNSKGLTRVALLDYETREDILFIDKLYHSSTFHLILVEHNIKIKKPLYIIDLVNKACTLTMKMPTQPIHKYRFVPNRIIETLLENSSLDLNKIACMDFTDDERMQFAQLIGYSVSGFGGLSYVDSLTADLTQKIAEGNDGDIRDIKVQMLTDKLHNIKKKLRNVVEEAFDVDGSNFDEKW